MRLRDYLEGMGVRPHVAYFVSKDPYSFGAFSRLPTSRIVKQPELLSASPEARQLMSRKRLLAALRQHLRFNTRTEAEYQTMARGLDAINY